MTLLGTIARGDTGGGFWMPPAASSIAGPIDAIFFMIYWICVFFLVLIVALMIIFIVRYRRRPGRKPEPSPTHHTPLELTWTIIPLILVIAIFAVGLKGYVDLTEAPPNSYEVYVTAQKWSWTFTHKNGCTETDHLTIPAGRPVKLIMTSEDVLHALFIPAFRVKQDVVPGRYTYLWFQTRDEQATDYQLFCAEYCGTDHSQMGATVHALPEGGPFETAMEEVCNWIDEYSDEEIYKAFQRIYPRCASCHNLADGTKIGPSFSETASLWGQSRVFRDGSERVVDENYIRDSLLNPAAEVVANFTPQMPAFAGQLKPREILAIVEFFKNYDKAVDAEGLWITDAAN